MTTSRRVHWCNADGVEHDAVWVAEQSRRPPSKIVLADDRLTADAAYRLAREGTGLLWVGDYHNARHLLQALDRRLNRRTEKRQAPSHTTTTGAPPTLGSEPPLTAAFFQQRRDQAERARILGMVLLRMEPSHQSQLRRAPDVAEACRQALGDALEPYVLPLKHLLGIVGAHEWRKAGVLIPELGGRIHAHYGVFSPIRGEYIRLAAQAPIPAAGLEPGGIAWDIGTGTGVLAAVLGQRGLPCVIGTDLSDQAVACARENIDRLDLGSRVEIRQGDMFPEGTADLIVCNPPWLPGNPSSVLEQAVYDPDSRMLRAFVQGLATRLRPNGEGWLILSDLAEHLQLRSRDWLQNLLKDSGLRVLGQLDTRPTHRRATDSTDPLHEARAAEVTSLWRLKRL